MSRGRYIALGVLACLVVGGIVVWQAWPRDDPARATVDDAVERFRQQQASGEGPGGAPPGVYRYETRGSESADTGVLSATHEYDGISTITLTPTSCGVLERWQVLAGRWTEAEFCIPPEGDGLKRVVEFHEFFGRSQEDGFRCSGDSPSRRMLRRAGTRFQSKCVTEGGTVESDSRVIGPEKVSVAGEAIDAIHTISDVTLEGDVTGTTTREDWRRRSDGLLLKRDIEADAERTGTIDADYSESYTIELIALEPRR